MRVFVVVVVAACGSTARAPAPPANRSVVVESAARPSIVAVRVPGVSGVVEIGGAGGGWRARLGDGRVLRWERDGAPTEWPGIHDAIALAVVRDTACVLRASGGVECEDPADGRQLAGVRSLFVFGRTVCGLTAGVPRCLDGNVTLPATTRRAWGLSPWTDLACVEDAMGARCEAPARSLIRAGLAPMSIAQTPGLVAIPRITIRSTTTELLWAAKEPFDVVGARVLDASGELDYFDMSQGGTTVLARDAMHITNDCVLHRGGAVTCRDVGATVTGLVDPIAIAAGGESTCALQRDGVVACW